MHLLPDKNDPHIFYKYQIPVQKSVEQIHRKILQKRYREILKIPFSAGYSFGLNVGSWIDLVLSLSLPET